MADVKETIMKLKFDKLVSGEIPVKLVKDCDFLLLALTKCISQSIENETFQTLLQSSRNLFDKAKTCENLSLLFKVCGRLMFNR